MKPMPQLTEQEARLVNACTLSGLARFAPHAMPEGFTTMVDMLTAHVIEHTSDEEILALARKMREMCAP